MDHILSQNTETSSYFASVAIQVWSPASHYTTHKDLTVISHDLVDSRGQNHWGQLLSESTARPCKSLHMPKPLDEYSLVSKWKDQSVIILGWGEPGMSDRQATVDLIRETREEDTHDYVTLSPLFASREIRKGTKVHACCVTVFLFT